MTPDSNYKPLTVQKSVLDLVEKYFKEENADGRNNRDIILGELLEYLVKTDDGSYTIRSQANETMHTHHGGLEESFEKYVKPSKLSGKQELKVLDVCSGLGYTSSVFLESAHENSNIHLDMVEISQWTLATSLIIPSPIKSHKFIKKAVEDKLNKMGFLKHSFIETEIPENIEINVHIEDARNLVDNITVGKYDAIFLIPFSPKLSPELYTLEFLKKLRMLLKEDGILSTFTASTPARSAMVHAGLHVGEGPRFGRSGGTMASLNSNRLENSLSIKQERLIALTDIGVPYRQSEKNQCREEIVEKRRIERLNARNGFKFASTVESPMYLCEDLPEGRLKRRVLKDIRRLGFDDLDTSSSRYLLCPQYSDCICGNGCKSFENSRDRVLEMEKRLNEILDTS